MEKVVPCLFALASVDRGVEYRLISFETETRSSRYRIRLFIAMLQGNEYGIFSISLK